MCAANSADFFKKTGTSTVTTLSAPGKALGATSINVGSTTGYPSDTGIVISIRTVDTSGKLIAGTHTEWSGTVTSGTSIAIEAAPVYGSDQIYAAGSTTQIAIRLSSYLHNKMVDGLTLAVFDQDGTMKAGAVDNAACFADDVVESAAIKDGAVTNAALVATIFSGQVLSQANAGTAGGTMYYINLGGIKLLWCTSAVKNTVIASTEYLFTLPTAFFTTVTTAIASALPTTADTKQVANISQITSATIGSFIWNTVAADATGQVMIFVIGT